MALNVRGDEQSEVLESKELFSTTVDHSRYHNSTLIFVIAFWYLDLIKRSLNSIMPLLDKLPNTYLVLIDSSSSPDIQAYVKTLHHDHLELVSVEENIGRAALINNYIRHYISAENLPETVVVIDADVTFSPDSFSYFIQAARNIPRLGMLSMRFTKNACNPEKNVFMPAHRYRGKDGHIYKVKSPTFCNVTGTMFALRGSVLQRDLNFRLFPKKKYEVYRYDEADLHNLLKYRYRYGYLEGTEATHLKSGSTIITD